MLRKTARGGRTRERNVSVHVRVGFWFGGVMFEGRDGREGHFAKHTSLQTDAPHPSSNTYNISRMYVIVSYRKIYINAKQQPPLERKRPTPLI